jgi:hypothetical protein
MTERIPRDGRRLFRNMRLAQEHADALAAQDTRPPEYVYATVDRKVLRAAIEFLRKVSGNPGEQAHSDGEKA